MSNNTADKVIELLQTVTARPALYFGDSSDYRRLLTFLEGFSCGLITLGVEPPNRMDFPNVLSKRGWSDYLTIDEMKGKGLTDEEIAKELLAIEIEIWKESREAKSE